MIKLGNKTCLLQNQQTGAALIIVLLLVSVLSVIAVGLTDQTVLASSRVRNEQSRSQLYWRAVGAETLAANLLSDAIGAGNSQVMSLDDIWAAQPFDLSALATTELEQGEIRFADASRCFNLNSLFVPDDVLANTEQTAPNSDDRNGVDPIPLDEQRIIEFAAILSSVGIAQNDARQLGIVIRDWIDPDANPGSGGAEDNTYLRLPVPYRTGNTSLADESELRAMIGVDPVLMSVIAPFICALPTSEPNRVNVNMLRLQDAPVLVGVFGGEISFSDAELIIERRPLGGYESINDVEALPFLSGLPIEPTVYSQRLGVRSDWLQGRMNLQFGKTFLESTMLFRVSADNRLTLVSRRIGS